MKNFISCYFIFDIILMLFSDQPTKEFCIYFIFLFGGTLLDLIILNDLYVFLNVEQYIEKNISDKDKDIHFQENIRNKTGINNLSTQFGSGIVVNKFLDTCILTILVSYRIFRIYSVAKKWYPKLKQTYRVIIKENETYCSSSSQSSSDCSLDENDIQQQHQENKKNLLTITPFVSQTSNSCGQQLQTQPEIIETNFKYINSDFETRNIIQAKGQQKIKKSLDSNISDKSSANLITPSSNDLQNILSSQEQQTKIQISAKQNQNQQQIKNKQQKQNSKKQTHNDKDPKSNQQKLIPINNIEAQQKQKQNSKQNNETITQIKLNSPREIHQTEKSFKIESKQNAQTQSPLLNDNVQFFISVKENNDGWMISQNQRTGQINNQRQNVVNLNEIQIDNLYQKNQENQQYIYNEHKKDIVEIDTKTNDINISNQNIKDLSISTVDTQDIQQTNQKENFKQTSFNYNNIIEDTQKDFIQDSIIIPAPYIQLEDQVESPNTRNNKEVMTQNTYNINSISNINSDLRNKNPGKGTKLLSQNNFQFEVKQKQSSNIISKKFGYHSNIQKQVQVQRKQQIYVQKKLLTQHEYSTKQIQQTTENLQEQISQPEKIQNYQIKKEESSQETNNFEYKSQSQQIEQNNNNKLFNMDTINNNIQSTKQISNQYENNILQDSFKQQNNKMSSDTQNICKENIINASNKSYLYVQDCQDQSQRTQKISYEKKSIPRNKQQILNSTSQYQQVRKSSRQQYETHNKQNRKDIQQTLNHIYNNNCKTPNQSSKNSCFGQSDNNFQAQFCKEINQTKIVTYEDSINETLTIQQQSVNQIKNNQENSQIDAVSFKLDPSENFDQQKPAFCFKHTHKKNDSWDSAIEITKEDNLKNDPHYIDYLANPLLEALSLPFRIPEIYSLSLNSGDQNSEISTNGFLFQQIGNWNGSKINNQSQSVLKETLNGDKEFKLNKKEQSSYKQLNPEGDVYKEIQQDKLMQIQQRENENFLKKKDDCFFKTLIDNIGIVSSSNQKFTQKTNKIIEYSNKKEYNNQEYDQIIQLNEELKEVIYLNEPIVLEIKGENGIVFETKIENLNDIQTNFNKACEKHGVSYNDILASKITILAEFIQQQIVQQNHKLLHKINLLLDELTLQYTLKVYSDQISAEQQEQFLRLLSEQKNTYQNSFEQESIVSGSSTEGQKNAFTVCSNQEFDQIEISNASINKHIKQNDILSSNNLNYNPKSQDNQITISCPEDEIQFSYHNLYNNEQYISNHNEANQNLSNHNLSNPQFDGSIELQSEKYNNLNSEVEDMRPTFSIQQHYQLQEASIKSVASLQNNKDTLHSDINIDYLVQENNQYGIKGNRKDQIEKKNYINNITKLNIQPNFQLQAKSEMNISSPLFKNFEIENLIYPDSSYSLGCQQIGYQYSKKKDHFQLKDINQNQQSHVLHSSHNIRNVKSSTFDDNNNFERINFNLDGNISKHNNRNLSIQDQWKFNPTRIAYSTLQQPIIRPRNLTENTASNNNGNNQRAWVNTPPLSHYIHESPAHVINKQNTQFNNQTSMITNNLLNQLAQLGQPVS